jgi:hypothetical protein
MLTDFAYNELLGIRASAMVLAERADRLISKEEKLRGVSTSSRTKKGLSDTGIATMLTKKRKSQLKSKSK